MSFASFLTRSQIQRNAPRANHAHPIRRPRFEAFEDRRMLSFSPATLYAVGTDPQAVVTADFNNDGHPDLVTANVGSNNVSVRLGNAVGAFGPSIDSAAGYGPRSIAVGDFDGDGNLDLAAVNGFGYSEVGKSVVSVMFGNGDGSFLAPTEIILDPNSAPQSVSVGDFNSDGTMDLALASNTTYPGYYYYGGVEASVLLSNGDRTFSMPSAPVSANVYGTWTTAAVATDFDGDGELDFLVGVAGDYVLVMLGDGEGHLALTGDFNWLIGNSGLASMAVGDINGDGVADLVAQDITNVKVRLGNGQAGFVAPPGGQSYAAGATPVSVALGDFDQDGALDVAVANYASNNFSILRGRGDGTFAPPQNFATGSGPYAVTVSDFNGDGWLDVATANFAGDTVSVLLNDQSWPVPLASVSISDATITEGNTGTTNATFTVTLSNVVGVDVTVAYDTANGSALASSDYTARSGTVTIPAGQTSRTFTVAVLGDRLAEPTETFVVNLSAPPNVTIGDSQGVGTILDDEPRISINDVSATEGNNKQTKSFTFTISLSAAYDQAVTVGYATANGTATAGSDYQSKTGTVTFAPGETTKTITVAVTGDKQKEANETFFVNLSGATVGEITDSQGLGTILNDDNGGAKGRFSLFALAVDASIEDLMFPGRRKRAR